MLYVNIALEQKVAQLIPPGIRVIAHGDIVVLALILNLNDGGEFLNNNKQSSVKDWVDLDELIYQWAVNDTLDDIN